MKTEKTIWIGIVFFSSFQDSEQFLNFGVHNKWKFIMRESDADALKIELKKQNEKEKNRF